MTYKISRGKRGRYRFTVRDHSGACVAVSTPYGYASYADADEVVKRLMGANRWANLSVEYA